MNRLGIVFLAISTVVAVSRESNTWAADPSGDMAGMKYNDGTAEGRRAVGGAGEMLHFTFPKEGEKIAGVRVHGSRYGAPEAPKEKFVVYILNADGTEILDARLAPYSLFEPGEEKWVDVKFTRPIELPKDFWVLLDVHATQSKGIYVSFDKSSEGKHSRMGLPWLEGARDVDFGGDWMIELMPAK